MARMLVKGSLVLFVSLALLVSLAHGLAYDAAYFRGLHDFVAAPENCAAPCFLGIRPGITMRDEALARLQAYPGVHDVYVEGSAIGWHWDLTRSPYLDSEDAAPRLTLDEHGVVDQILVVTRVRVADIWTAFGAPDNGRLMPYSTTFDGGGVRSATYVGSYPQTSFLMLMSVSCPSSPHLMWDAPVMLIWRAGLIHFDITNQTVQTSMC
jgi:hypothetical protein